MWIILRESVLAGWSRPTKQKIYDLYSQLLSAPRRLTTPMKNPKRWPTSTSSARLARDAHLSLTSSDLYDRIHGAWLARTAGCVLGKPLQMGWSKSKVIQYLHQANSYPLRDYVPRLVPPPAGFEFMPEAEGSFLGEIHGAPQDDDTDYTHPIPAAAGKYGLDFRRPMQLPNGCAAWRTTAPLPLSATPTAIWSGMYILKKVASFVNPDREFVGARTRADLYGYAAPGKPELAAALAYRDAALSHTKNGLYSAMLMAAMVSWAFVTSDLEEIIQVGLSEIPERSRLAEAVRDVLDAFHDLR
jgi:hypothetical protein